MDVSLNRFRNDSPSLAQRSRPLRSVDEWLQQSAVSTEFEITDVHLPVLVVGAGPAGLAAMAALKRAGVAFEGVESHSRVGGIWDQSNPLSSIYDSLKTNTSRLTTHLALPMPRTWPDYPHHRQVKEYLQYFATVEGLISRIHFRTDFERAWKSDRGTWFVALRTAGASRSFVQEVRAIVVATGFHHKRNRIIPEPMWQQAVSCKLDVIHSSDYRCAASYAGKRVLVVGLGVSGADIADEVSRVAARTLLSFRNAPWIVPANVLGKPADAAVGAAAWLPFWVQREALRVAQAWYVGHPRHLGLPIPTHGLLDRFAIADRGISKALRARRVVVRSRVTSIREGVAVFEDPGQRPEAIDAVIFATGYARRYPLLDELRASSNDLSDDLAFLIFDRRETGLTFMSLPITTTGGWPVFVEQGRAIAAYFAAEQRGGANIQAFNARRRLPSPDFKRSVYRRADGFHVDGRTYARSLRRLTGWLSE
jgi:cation diffusion facilitator CzcD-associated flavoprotein CzcO